MSARSWSGNRDIEMQTGLEVTHSATSAASQATVAGGLAGWLLERLRVGFGSKLGRGVRRVPRLTLVERISLAPRQQLALVEAEGRRLLVATSPDGAPTFYPLGGEEPVIPGAVPHARSKARRGRGAKVSGRVSW
jgi:Flagellar biosynthesis protein, FliO